jgi:MFS-type transporter involved in bile tolerance (Atg22 family)
MAYAMGFFLPIILRENMEYSVGMSQVLSAFPSWLGCVVMLILAWVGDKYHIRGPLLLINCAFGIAGACLLVSASESSLN